MYQLQNLVMDISVLHTASNKHISGLHATSNRSKTCSFAFVLWYRVYNWVFDACLM